MLQIFRSFSKSKFGVALALGFLVLIALAFASGDVANSGKFGGIAGGDRVATIGSDKISTSALSQGASSALENLKQENPRLSMQAFVSGGGLEQVLASMIDRAAIASFGKSHGIVAGDRLVDSEIAKIPVFKGADGKFNEDAYRQMLQQRGLTDKIVREDLAQGLIAQQIAAPAQFGTVIPQEAALRYAALLRETRSGSIALLPSAAFVPKVQPSDKELADFYNKNRDHYIRPERRVIRYAIFGDAALKNLPAPTDAEIAARYEANKAQYAASEQRRVTQLVLPTEAAARAVMDETSKGTSLEAAAAAKGLKAASLGALSKGQLSGLASQAVADATFAIPSGKVAGPAKSGLGWHLMRVDAIDRKPERTLAQVRGEIATQLAAEKRRAGLSDLTARFEEEFDKGGSLTDAAKELGLTPVQTAPLTADGKVYGKPQEQAPAVLARVIQTAFSMERENEPQVAEVEAGKIFVLFDVTDITPSAPAPLAEIKNDVAIALMLDKGSKAAKIAAEKILADVRKGQDIGAAMAKFGIPLPPVDRLTINREQLAGRTDAVAPPIALMFSMAEGTAKSLAAPRNRGWYVVALKDIVPGQVTANDPILKPAMVEMGRMTGREYADQLRMAIRSEVGVKRNETAIKAVAKQLSGEN